MNFNVKYIPQKIINILSNKKKMISQPDLILNKGFWIEESNFLVLYKRMYRPTQSSCIEKDSTQLRDVPLGRIDRMMNFLNIRRMSWSRPSKGENLDLVWQVLIRFEEFHEHQDHIFGQINWKMKI